MGGDCKYASGSLLNGPGSEAGLNERMGGDGMEAPKDGLSVAAQGSQNGSPVATREEWAVVIVEGRALDTVATSAKGAPVLKDEPQRMVGICQVGELDGQPLTICADEAEAFRISEAVGAQLQLPLYDGADALAVQVDAGEYADLEADGPDPYSEYRSDRQAETAGVVAGPGEMTAASDGVGRRDAGQTLRFRIYPDRWEMSAGPEPMLGPIEAPDARSAYHTARDRGMYPAGVAFGLRAVALDEYGRLAPERGVWGGTQETPEWAAYESALQQGREVRRRGRVSQAPDRTKANQERQVHEEMKIEARNMKLLDNRTDNLLAVCDLNLGGDYVVQGVRVLRSSKDGKAFVSLPSYQDKNGDYHEVAHPVTAQAREVTNRVVLREWERQVLAQLPKTADGPER